MNGDQATEKFGYGPASQRQIMSHPSDVRAALERVAEKLRRAGAILPAPPVNGTIEGSIVTGLCIALAVIEGEMSRWSDVKSIQD